MHSFYQPVKRNLIIISIPNAGHIKILARMASAARQSDPNLNIYFILTSWMGHVIRENYLDELKNACGNNPITVLESVNTSNSKDDTFGRAKELIDQVGHCFLAT